MDAVTALDVPPGEITGAAVGNFLNLATFRCTYTMSGVHALPAIPTLEVFDS